MNKIYKLIWSKVKNCYIVVSELAKSHTKSPASGVVGQQSLENKVLLSLMKGNSFSALCSLQEFVVPSPVVKGGFLFSHAKPTDFKITVAAIVKNEAANVPTWVQAARSCADEVIVVDTGSTDGTVERFADYGIKCFHYDWNDDFASAKNYMISLCHGDWIVLLDGDEWFREGCDVRKAIAKHHGNPITKAIIADWICLDKDRNNAVMFSGGAVRAFRNQPDVRYFRKVHENLTINYENFAFEPEFKMYHTGYSGSVNRSKHERNLRIMRTMFDFDNGKVEYPTDWRYIEDTYAGLGQFDKALWAADKMISYGVQEYSAAAWITKFNVLFAMRTPLAEMRKQFEYCFQTVPSVSGFRFLASIYYFRNGLVAEGLDNYIEGLRMLMGPQDKVAQEHTYWRMYMPEASALASAVYLQNKQVEASLYACTVCEQYCGQTDWTNGALADVRRVMNQTEEGLLANISERVLPVLQFGKRAVLATALASSLTVGMVGIANPVYAVGPCTVNATVTGGKCNTASGTNSSVTGGNCNTASGCCSVVAGGQNNKATCEASVVIGGYNNTASNSNSLVGGGSVNTASGFNTVVLGGMCNTASCNNATVVGGCGNTASAACDVAIGGYCNYVGIYYSYVNGNNRVFVSPTCTSLNLSTGKITVGSCTYTVSVHAGCYAVVLGGNDNYSIGNTSLAAGGRDNIVTGTFASIFGGCSGRAYASDSVSIGGGIAGSATCANTAQYSVAIGKNATTTQNYEIAIGSSDAPVKIDGALTVDGAKTVTDGTTTKSWTELLSGGSPCFADGVVLAGCTNTASGSYSSVSGGSFNKATSFDSSVSGGVNNTASAYASSVSGGECNTASGEYSSVIGGCSNKAKGTNSSVTGGNCNTASCTASSVSGGQCNTASGCYSSISGGYCNTASCNYASVNGGGYNTASGCYSLVAGGYNGKAYATFSTAIGGGIAGDSTSAAIAQYSVAIGSGATTTRNYEVAIGSNTAPVKIGGNLTVTGTQTVTDGTTTKSWTELLNAGGGSPCFADGVVLAGCTNTTSGCYSSVSGGECNTASGFASTVTGGSGNVATNYYSSVSGGTNNTANCDNSSVSGGSSNTASGYYSSVSGGECNTASCYYSFVSGGQCNTASGYYSSVTGGCGNIASNDNSSVSGGQCNTASCFNASVSGGAHNIARAENSSITGGWCNIASGKNSSINGGQNNTASGCYSSVSAGYLNIASGEASSVSSGRENIASSDNSSVNGGWCNTASGSISSVTGGQCNTASGSRSSVIGGYCNTASGMSSSIIGGCNSFAYACYSTAIGGGVAGVSACDQTALGSVAIGKNAITTRDYEIAIGSSDAPVKINGVLTVDGAKTVTDGTTTKSWTELLNAGGGADNTISGNDAFVSGGYNNVASSCASSVSGGSCNIAGTLLSYHDEHYTYYVNPDDERISSDGTTIRVNNVDYELTSYEGEYSSVSGGSCNYAVGDYSSVTGGRQNVANEEGASITGGICNVASGFVSSVSGGSENKASGYYTSISGGQNNTATCLYASVSGGEFNHATAESAYIAGGSGNIASGLYASVFGSAESEASGIASAILGGETNVASGAKSTVVGGESNEAVGNKSTVIGGCFSTAYACYSIVIGGGITGNSSCSSVAIGSVAIGKGAVTTVDNEVALGSDDAPVTLGGRLAVGSEQIVSTGTKSASWSDILDATEGSALSVRYNSSETKSEIALEGTGGTKITNVKSGLLSASSLEAVNGAQLYAVKQDISGFAADINRNKETISTINNSVSSALASVSSVSTLVTTLDGLKADVSLNNLSNSGKQLIATYAACAVQEYMASQQSSASALMAPMMYSQPSNSLTVTDAGNGSLHVGEGSYVNGTSSIAIGVGNQVNANNSGAFGDPSIIDADESYVLGNDDRITANAKGSFIVGNDSKADAEGSLILGSNVESTGQNGLALGNNTNVMAENAVALGSGSVASEMNTISVGNTDLKRKIVNVMDGDVSEGSTEVITGNQLFVLNKKVQQNTDVLQTKAETDASNIDVPKWAEKLGTGQIEAGNDGLVTGGTVFNALEDVKQQSSMVTTDGSNIYLGRNVGGNTIDVSNNLGEGRVITGVITNHDDKSSAANVGYVQAVTENVMSAVNNNFAKVDRKVNKVGANAAALASLTPASFEGDERWSLAASVGHYEGQTAGAVGAFYKPMENVMINVRGAFADGENMFGGGVAVSLNKGDVPGVTKRKLATAVNQQAQVINHLQQEREKDRAVINNLQNEVAELKALVASMVPQN